MPTLGFFFLLGVFLVCLCTQADAGNPTVSSSFTPAITGPTGTKQSESASDPGFQFGGVVAIFLVTCMAVSKAPKPSMYRLHAVFWPWSGISPRAVSETSPSPRFLTRFAHVAQAFFASLVLKYIGCLPLWEPIELADEPRFSTTLLGPLRLGMGKHFSRYRKIEGRGFGHARGQRPVDSLREGENERKLWPKHIEGRNAATLPETYDMIAVDHTWIVPLFGTGVSAPGPYKDVCEDALAITVKRLQNDHIRVALPAAGVLVNDKDASDSSGNASRAEKPDDGHKAANKQADTERDGINARVYHDGQMLHVTMSSALNDKLRDVDEEAGLIEAPADCDDSRSYLLTSSPFTWYGFLTVAFWYDDNILLFVICAVTASFFLLCHFLANEDPGPSERVGWLNRKGKRRDPVELPSALQGAVMALATGTCMQLQSSTHPLCSPVVRVHFESVFRQYRIHGADQGRPSIKVWSRIDSWPSLLSVVPRLFGYFAHSINDAGFAGWAIVLSAVWGVKTMSIHRSWIWAALVIAQALPLVVEGVMHYCSAVWWMSALSLGPGLPVDKLNAFLNTTSLIKFP